MEYYYWHDYLYASVIEKILDEIKWFVYFAKVTLYCQNIFDIASVYEQARMSITASFFILSPCTTILTHCSPFLPSFFVTLRDDVL